MKNNFLSILSFFDFFPCFFQQQHQQKNGKKLKFSHYINLYLTIFRAVILLPAKIMIYTSSTHSFKSWRSQYISETFALMQFLKSDFSWEYSIYNKHFFIFFTVVQRFHFSRWKKYPCQYIEAGYINLALKILWLHNLKRILYFQLGLIFKNKTLLDTHKWPTKGF